MVVKINGKTLQPSDGRGEGESVSPAASPSPLKSAKAKRPKEYAREAVMARVVARMAKGETLTKICQSPGMPTRAAIYLWMQEDATIKKQYGDGERLQEQCWADQAVSLLDEVAVGDITQTVNLPNGHKTKSVRTADKIALAKAKAEARRWLLARRDPERYGVKQVGVSVGGTTNINGNKEVVYTVINSPDA
jgi:hypothetical protein